MLWVRAAEGLLAPGCCDDRLGALGINQLRKQHGNDALEVAGKRLDAMLEADDREGYWVWCQILTRISKLGPVVTEGTTAH